MSIGERMKAVVVRNVLKSCGKRQAREKVEREPVLDDM